MKTIFWDEHIKPVVGIPILDNKSKNLVWFYMFNKIDGFFDLYHNVEI